MKTEKTNKYLKIFERIAKENKINFEYSFKSNVGRADFEQRKVFISKPINRNRLQTALHEISHILQGEIKPIYVEEYLAEVLSFEMIKKEGIPISKKARDRSKKHIAYMTQKAIHRGLKKIDKRVKNYIKSKYPNTAKGERRFI